MHKLPKAMISRVLRTFAIAITLVLATQVSAVSEQPIRILPVDEAKQDPEFLEFREQLIAAVRARDIDKVVAAASHDIKLSFGGDYGRDRFRELLVADNTGDGGSYWQELQWALTLGGVFNDEHGRQFCTPYVSCNGPHQCTDCDPFETLVSVTDNAPVYLSADADAPVIARLAYETVTLLDYGAQRQKVQLADGRIGYVSFPNFRSPIGYRAYFEKREGRWQMRLFIAGD